MQLNNKQKVNLSLVFKDVDNNPAVGVVGVPLWESSNQTIVTLVVSSDGLSATALTVDNAVGSSQITVNHLNLSAVLDIDVVAAPPVPSVGNATTSEIIVGTVELK